jgi:FixJ family two-component response regulator
VNSKGEITQMHAHDAGCQSLDRALTRTPVSTVFIVDTDPPMREFMASLIEPEGWAVESLASTDEFLAHPPSASPSCLILDLSVPRLDGLALQEIISDRSETPLVFVTAHRHDRIAARARKAGAIDLLTQPVSRHLMLSAVRSALERSRLALAGMAVIRALRERYGMLSRRERDVLHLVLTGCLNKQIGAELGISEITVKAHRGKMMRKMAATSLAELVYMGTRLGLNAVADPAVRAGRRIGIRNEANLAH